MKLKFLLMILTVITVFTVSCDVANNDDATGSIHVMITDAPFPTDLIQEANVTIDKVEIGLCCGQDSTYFITLSEEEFSVNLLELSNGITADLAQIEVPAGEYNQVRLHVKEASILLKDGQTFDLTIPSGITSGLKINIKPSIVISGGTMGELLLDFDVSRSFVVQGNPWSGAGIKGFLFKPVIKAVNNYSVGKLTGTVTDILSTPIAGAQVSVYAADTLNTTTFTCINGKYVVLGLESGTYDVKVEAEGFTSQTVEDIEITATTVTTQDFVLESE